MKFVAIVFFLYFFTSRFQNFYLYFILALTKAIFNQYFFHLLYTLSLPVRTIEFKDEITTNLYSDKSRRNSPGYNILKCFPV